MYERPWPNGNATSSAARVVPAVADEQALAVADVRELAREVEERRGVLEAQRDRLGELRRRVDLAEQHVGGRAAAGLAEQPGLEDRGHAVGEGQRDDAAVREHDDGVRVGREHRVEQRELVGRQVDVFAVVALGLEAGRQAEEHDGDVGSGCRGHGLVARAPRSRRRRRRRDAEALRRRRRPGRERADPVERACRGASG